LVLKKSKKDNKVLFINAEREFARSGNKNKLRPEDIEKVLSKYTDRKDEEFFSRHVDHTEIADNDYSLSVTSYVVAEDTRVEVDIKELNRSISEIVARQSTLRTEIDKIVASFGEPSQ
jgi:type I restriction enzyme M protein